MRPSLILLALLVTSIAGADLRPDKVHVANAKKTQAYIRDGLITGGDKAINEVVIKDIRRASNNGYERIVIDLEGTQSGESAAIPRPPYYQVSITPDEKRLVFTIWGKPKLGFDSNRVKSAFKKSGVVQTVELLPRVEDNTWSFVLGLRGESPVEVFELSKPVRIILDIKAVGKPVPEDETPAPAPKHSTLKSKPKPKPKAAAPKAEAPPKSDVEPKAGANEGAALDEVPSALPADAARKKAVEAEEESPHE